MLACGSAALALIASNAHAQATAVGQPASGQTAAGDADQAARLEQDLQPQTPAPEAAIGAGNQDREDAREIVVTGSSIRGAPPVGSNLISVGRAEIEDTAAQTVQQILKTVPAVTGLGSVGQGGFGSADGSGTNAPTIHGLGASASNSTLILIDGHRLPLSGINHTLADPNIVPSIAIERVEVLPDGASAVYGSDAVAGVINFITRRRYDGVEANGQIGFADGGYRTYNGSLLAGKTWDTGSALVAYNYSHRSNLLAGKRPFTARDHRAQGGSNLASFACGPASIQPTGSTLIYASPYGAANGVANAQANAFCDYTGRADLIPDSKSDTAFIKVTQEIGERTTVNVNADYSNRRNKAINVRGSVQATVFGPGSGRGTQINPFFVGVAGTAATSQTVRFDANDLLGTDGYTEGSAEDFFVNASVEYRLTDDLRLTATGLVGADTSKQQIVGGLCISCAYLALNGTTNAAGSLTTPSIPGTTTIVTRPLTTGNALDVWSLLAGNRTPNAIRAELTDSTDTQYARQSIKDGTIKIDGTLAKLPGGDLKFAVGGEAVHYTLRQDLTRPLNIGPATTGSSTLNLRYRPRTVVSAFIETLIPIIGPEMDVPFVRSLSLNLSGRYDHYNDFGSTKNPKVAADWEIMEGLKLRANFAKSFVAPALTSRGADQFGTTGESGYAGNNAQINVPTALFPGIAGALPNCAVGAVTCQIGGNLQGIQLNGGNADLDPQKGRTYSIGGDFSPSFLPGFRAGVTYWNNRITGGVTSPQASLAVNIPSLAPLMQIFPNGATPAQIAAATQGLAQTAAISSPIYYIYNFSQKNVLNLDVSGIDVDASYSRDTDYGKFSIGASLTRKLMFDQSFGNSAKFSVLNTTGFNTTFPSIKLEGRANIGWAYGGFSADVFVNHTGGYRNFSGNTVLPITRDAIGLPTGGGDRVKSSNIVDLHLSYTIEQEFAKKFQIFADVQNLFDKVPVFYNSNNGYDTFSGNPLLRVITLGLRGSF
jgi:iron complex outermembrane receptor protein